MASLAYCLKHYSVSEAEAELLRKRVDDYLAKQMTQAEAELTATKEWIKELEDERAGVVRQITTLAEEARKRHRDPWFSFDFAVKNAPKLKDRIQNLAQMFTDSNALAGGDIYDGTYAIPKKGGILAARRSKLYETDEAYRDKIESVIEEIKSHLRDTIYMFQIVTSQARSGVLGVEYAIVEDPDLPLGEPKVEKTEAWKSASRDMYGQGKNLGGISIREGLQNSVDAVYEAVKTKRLRKEGHIDVNIYRPDGQLDGNAESSEYARWIGGSAFDVTDDGIGMDADVIDNSFMALFKSGKPAGKNFGGKGVACAVIMCPCDGAEFELETNGFYHSSERINALKNIARLDPARVGTKISVKSPSGEKFIKEDAYRYLEVSEMPKFIQVTLNGKALENPFHRKKAKTYSHEANMDTINDVNEKGEPDPKWTKYEIKYYRNIRSEYNNKLVIRLYDPVKGVRLAQAINPIGGSQFKGAIVVDVETKASPKQHDHYPLDQSRMRFKWDMDKVIDNIVEEHTIDTVGGAEDVSTVEYDIADRLEWKDTLARIAANDKEWTTFSDELYRIWETHKAPAHLPKEKQDKINADLDELRRGNFPFDHPNAWKVSIDKGYKGYKGGSMFHAKLGAVYQMFMRLSTPYMGGRPISQFSFLLSKPDSNGAVTEANFQRYTGNIGLNPVVFDKNALKSALHTAHFIKYLADHELTHNFAGYHNEEFTGKNIKVMRSTALAFPAQLAIAEAFTGLKATEVRTDTKTEVQKVVEKVPYEVEKIIRQLIPQAQLDLWDDQEVSLDRGHVELFTPGNKKTLRQLRLFGNRLVGQHDRLSGDDASAEPGGRAQLADSQGDDQARPRDGGADFTLYGRAAENAEIIKHGFSVVDYMAKANPKFEQGGLVNITDLLEEIKKDHPDFAMKDLAPWLDKLANSGKYKKGRPYLFLVKAIDPKKIKYINSQGGIFGRKIELAKIGGVSYQQVGIRETMAVATPKLKKSIDKTSWKYTIDEFTPDERKQLSLELGVRAARSPSIYTSLHDARERYTKTYASASEAAMDETARLANQARALFGDAIDFADAYLDPDAVNFMYSEAESWANGDIVIRDDIISRILNPVQYATRQATPASDMGVSLADIQNLFKGQSVAFNKDGNVTVKTIGGETLIIKAVDEISPDQVAFNIGYGKLTDVGMPVVGQYHDGVIELHRDLAGNWTLSHETYHWLEDAGFVTSKESDALGEHIRKLAGEGKWQSFNKNDVGGAEDRANFVAWNLEMRKADRGTLIGRIIQKIRDFIDSLAGFFQQSPRSLLREVETGKVFTRDTAKTQAAGIARYTANAPIFYSEMTNWVDSDKFPGKGTPDQLIDLFDKMASPPFDLTDQISALEILKRDKGLTDEQEAELKKLRKETSQYKNVFKREEFEWSGVFYWLGNYQSEVYDTELAREIDKISEDILKYSKRYTESVEENEDRGPWEDEDKYSKEYLAELNKAKEAANKKSKKAKVSKQEVLDFIRANAIGLEEKLLGEEGEDYDDDTETEYHRLDFEEEGQYQDPDPSYIADEADSLYENDLLPEFLEEEGLESKDDLTKAQKEELREEAERLALERDYELGTYRHEDDRGLGYAIYSYNQGEYYEVTDPDGIQVGTYYRWDAAVEAAEGHAIENYHEDMIESRSPEFGTRWRPYQEGGGEEYRELLLYLPLNYRRGTKYRMPIGQYGHMHWPDTDNVVVHVRWNEREDKEGRKLLFVEELQSDWLQQGHKKGYYKDQADRADKLAKAKAHQRAAESELNRFLDAHLASISGKDKKRFLTVVHEDIGFDMDMVIDTMAPEARKQYDALAKLKREAEMNRAKAESLAPYGPFRASTAWGLLGFKRVVRYAAEHGFEAIGWTPGIIQINRWENELRKKVDKITAEKLPGEKVLLSGVKGENEVFKEEVPIYGATELRPGKFLSLEDLLDPAMAIKIRESKRRKEVFEGEGLTIGGKGFKEFYDKIVPSTVNKYFYKDIWGKPKVGIAKIEIGTQKAYAYEGEEVDGWAAIKLLRKDERSLDVHEGTLALQQHKTEIIKVYDHLIGLIEEGKGVAEAINMMTNKPPPHLSYFIDRGLNRAAELLGGKINANWVPKYNDVWSLPITPQMRRKALTEGFPQYSILPDWAKALYAKTKNPEVANFAKDMPEIEANAWQRVGRLWRAKKQVHLGLGTDTTVMDRLLSLPTHYFRKIPALARMLKTASRRSDNYYHILNAVENTESGNGVSGIAFIDKFKKQDKGEYRRVKDYLVKRDRDANGYTVVHVKGGFELREPKKQGQTTGDRIQFFNKSNDAWAYAIEHEGRTLSNEGFSDMAVDAVKIFRKITHRGFALLEGHMNRLVKQAATTGKPLPKVIPYWSAGKKTMVDLKVALAIMGDVRGHYFPRERLPGQYTAYAIDPEKDDAKRRNPHLKNFDYEWTAAKFKADMERQGYEVKVERQKKLPEDVYQAAGQISALNEILNKALESTVTHKEEMKKVELEFAKALAEQIADVIKVRGVRAHMVTRNQATGNGVWLGYEEDPVEAIAKYARGVSAGEAKKIMAHDMLLQFTGNDVSWKKFKAQRIADYLRAQGDAIPEDLDDKDLFAAVDGGLARSGLKPKDIVKYKDYMAHVKSRKVDPIREPKAYHDGMTYMMDMLRNDEAVDRFIGTIKGVAVLKYLGYRVAAPLVNLTAMVTSVPAAMKGIAGIPIHKTFGYFPKALKAWRDYTGLAGGKQANLDVWTKRAFDKIYDQGWHKSQYNKEALSVLKTELGRAWDTFIEFAMLGFGYTEMSNRVSTIAGTYMALKEKNAAAFEAASDSQKMKLHDQWLDTAKEVSDKAHGVYGKVNRPHFARGANVAAHMAQTFYVFKTFAHNYLLTMADLGFKQKEYGAFAYMAISPAILAGLGASPILTVLFKALGLVGADEPEEALYNWVEANLGGRSSALARLGIFGLGGVGPGVSMKGSLEINFTEIPTSLKDLAGAPGSIVSDIYLGTKSLARGDYLKGLEKLSPNALGSVFKGVREHFVGLTTESNAPIFYGKERVKLTTTEMLMRALSFNPARIAAIRERQYKDRRLVDKYEQIRHDIYAKLKDFYDQPKERRDPNDLADLLLEVRSYNARVKEKELPLDYITSKSIKNNLRRAMRPSKWERQRAVDQPIQK